jgi:twitching motility protein PilT
MNFDFADLLMDVVARRASDLHITAGAPPMVRVRGRLVGVEGYPRLSQTDTREVVYSILTNDQRQKLETEWQIDFAYSVPGHARFRVNAYFQRSAIGAAFRLTSACRPRSTTSPRSPAASSSSPGRPARASRPRWRP